MEVYMEHDDVIYKLEEHQDGGTACALGSRDNGCGSCSIPKVDGGYPCQGAKRLGEALKLGTNSLGTKVWVVL